MTSQVQASTEAFNEDVNLILTNHETEKKQQGGGNTSRGRGKGTRGRGRGRKSSDRQTRSITKGQIRNPKDGTTDKENNDQDERNGSEKEEELTSIGEGSEQDDEANEDVEEGTNKEKGVDREEDNISLENEAEFVIENAHIERESDRYVAELERLFKKGKMARFQMLEIAYEKWCEKAGVEPKSVVMLGCSSDKEEVEVNQSKRKGKTQVAEKPAKIGKTMNHGTVLTHQLIDLSPYWDSRMQACFGYVPLTIFVQAWLLADKTHMSNRKKQSTSCSDIVAYVGLRVPNKWRQSFLMWSTSFNLYVQYWRVKYGREDIAARLEEHYKVGWDLVANGDEQITAVSGGRMLSHLASAGGSHANHVNTSHGQHAYHGGNYNSHLDHHEHGNGNISRGRGKRGRSFGRGVGNRGGNSRQTTHTTPTTLVNGVAVPKFGPGAFEAIKAAKQSSASSSGAVTQ
ncbi:uncharacterized protein MELLADRAFT_103279 [Melampsora larici-populina 98AG31]|uniref:Uncharacterized protein n=1 Tax=Melampsora larici-populina (strain 98AG31 / pathotype 3-4-7) TaxID=747676 RepID=F4R9W4_MELLP|nr:uncharacterized protein MELLADRAFT_103279 [Melampsora larici-populina 98AG31]EGG10599.1 hypothetical protein MELLADRAFT_103279 [Melampsora larici-populina 98AG31]